MLKAVLFDMDGLIFDTESIYKHSWQFAANEQCLDLNDSFYQNFLGVQDIECEAMLAEYFVDLIDMKRFKRIRDENYHQRRKKGIAIKPGFAELFAAIKERSLKTAIVTSSHLSEVKYNFRNTCYLTQYDLVITAEDVVRGKPNPDCYLMACDKLGFNPDECLVLEDSNNGVRASLNAKCHTIMIPDLLPAATDVEHVEKVIDLKQVIPYLDKL